MLALAGVRPPPRCRRASIMAASALVEQLKAAASFLTQLEKGSNAYKEVVTAQCCMAMSVMEPWTFVSAEDSAALILQIGKMPFGKKKLAMLLGRVTEIATTSANMLVANVAAGAELMSVTRTPMQDFTPITSYLTAAQWAEILDQDSDFMGRVAVMMQACKKLGLRTLHEPTIQMATCTALAVEGFERAIRQPPLALFGYFKRAKSYTKKLLPWKECKRLAEVEPSFVDKLPEDTAAMRRAHRDVYSRVYGESGDAPVKCPLDVTQLLVLSDAVPMRENKARLKTSPEQSSVDMALQLADRAIALNRGREDSGALRDREVPFRRYTPSQADPLPLADAAPAPAASADAKKPSKHSVEEARDKIYAQLGGKTPSVSHKPPSLSDSESDDDGSDDDSDCESEGGAPEASAAGDKKRKADEAKAEKAKGKNYKKKHKKNEKATKKTAAAAKAAGDKKKKKKKKANADKKSPKPSYSVEWSRDQVLCRTGMKGAGQSVAYKFADYGGSSDKAISAAKKWVAAQAKKCVAG